MCHKDRVHVFRGKILLENKNEEAIWGGFKGTSCQLHRLLSGIKT